jgi:Flp pilus assembly protein TadD
MFPISILGIALLIIFPAVASSRAASSKEQICDVSADYALGLGDYPTAITLHRKLLRLHPDDALAHYHLGFAYGMTGRLAEEIREYLEAARLGLNKWDLFLNLGVAYLGQNESLKATDVLQTAVSLGPDHPEAHFNLAIAYERDHRLPEALREITASLRLAPTDPDERNIKAVVCAELGDLVCARDEWTHLVQVAPGYLPARVNLAILNGSHKLLAASTFTTREGFAYAQAVE